jgi:hypothetical protein
MSDTKSGNKNPAPAAKKPVQPAKFDLNQTLAQEPVFDVKPFTPRKVEEAEPMIAEGMDLSGKTKIVFVNGRGKTGKTTFLRWAAERALLGNRPILMADLDPTNASFSSYFQDVARPNTDDPAGVAQWMQRFIEYAVENQTTAVLDLGGGDTTLRETAAEMPGFASAIAEAGAVPVLISLVGSQVDDLAPIATLRERGFSPDARAIMFNEASKEIGHTRDQSFGRLLTSAVVVDEVTDGAVPLWMPRLNAAAAVESRRSLFSAARDGLTTPPLGMFDRSKVRTWLEAMDRRFAGITSWLP